MDKRESKPPELKILPEALESPERLEVAEDGRQQGSPSPSVERLMPDREAKLNVKSIEPDVTDILSSESEVLDLEDTWVRETDKVFPVGWFILGGCLLCVLAFWAVKTLYQAQPELEEVLEKKVALEKKQSEEDKETRKILFSMEECVRGYLGAESIAEKLKYVRHPDRVKPLMEHYYQTHKLEKETFERFSMMQPMGLDQDSFLFVKAVHEGGQHDLLLEQVSEIGFRVDWESDVCYLPISWKEYIKKQPTEPMSMRVYIEPDNFYAYEFSDESQYASFKLTTRDEDEHLFGFVKKGSEVWFDIQKYMKKSIESGGGGPEPLILQLRFPQGSHSKRCVLIERLVAPRWIYVKSPKK